MATQAYWTWKSLGSPWDPALPIAEIETWAEQNGISVLGTIGNQEHLTADRPQDHTPFSSTAWPFKLPGYIVTAIDLANVRGLGQAIEDQARAGLLPWLKYMNHSGRHLDSRDLDGDGQAWEVYPSSDKHVHLSIRTDWIYRSVGVFDPFKTHQGDNTMPWVLKVTGNHPAHYASDGRRSRHIPAAAAPAILREVEAKRLHVIQCDNLEQLFALGGPLEDDGPVEVEFTPEQILQLSDQSATAFVERLGPLQFAPRLVP